jgi:hypothetical protein
VIDKNIEQNMSVADMRMLRWMRVTREDRIIYEYMRGSIGVVFIEYKMRENRLKWSWNETRGNKCSKNDSYCIYFL